MKTFRKMLKIEGILSIRDMNMICFAIIMPILGKCKFTDCSHTNEPGCMILEAIKNGNLSQERYNSYIKLKNEARYNNDSENYLKEKKEKFKEIAKYNKKNMRNKM